MYTYREKIIDFSVKQITRRRSDTGVSIKKILNAFRVEGRYTILVRVIRKKKYECIQSVKKIEITNTNYRKITSFKGPKE